MKRTITKLISILVVMIMCFSMLPVEAFAWGKMTHVYTANIVDDMADEDYVTLKYPYDAEDAANDFRFSIPDEYLQAIAAYPDAFRAGALGPDVYPDIVTGQMYIHPENVNIDSGEWVKLLCDTVNKMGKDTEGRKIALSFTLGCMLHYCGDLFGHDFVNTFSGGSFPSLLSPDMLDLKGEKLNNVLSHLSVEKYMDNLLYPYYRDEDGNIDAPDRFVADAMIFDGTPAAGLAPLYAKYPAAELELDIDSDLLKDILDGFYDEYSNNVPPYYTAMLALREYVISTADEYRENMDPVSAIITRYCDEWAADIDTGIYEFTATCDSIARRMTVGGTNPKIEEAKKWEDWKNTFNPNSLYDEVLEEFDEKGFLSAGIADGLEQSTLGIIKEEMDFWVDEYGLSMIGIPDILIDGISIDNIDDMDARKALQTIVDFATLSPLFDAIKAGIKELIGRFIGSEIIEMVKERSELSGDEIAEIVSKINDRMEDPKRQLDHPDNPYKPSANNYAELMEYMDSLSDERQHFDQDSEFEALYNTLTMFKLVLMGPENYTKFVQTYAGVRQTAYQKNTARLEASSLRLEIKTSDLYLSGTDDNIYVVVYKRNADGSKEQLVCKLLDVSGSNDFEFDDRDTYLVELPQSVKLTELELALSKTPAFDFLPSLTDDWCCENIRVTPMYAGYELTAPIDLGGVHLKGICKSIGMNFQKALKAGRESQNRKTQPVTNLKVRIHVRDVLYAGSDSDIYLVADYGNRTWAKVCLDKAVYNDLERGDNDTYMIPVTAVGKNVMSIPLDELRIRFVHDGSDEANWKEVTVTPCYGDLELTDPISLGGKTFEDSAWKPELQTLLGKTAYKQYEPFALEYETILDDGLLSYMGSLDGGEEWVDSGNELWANTTLRKKIFFEIFKGFTPEILYTGEPTVLQGDPVEIALDFTGVWNGVSNERRSQVKDFQHVYPVEGGADLALVNENGEVVYSASGVDVAGGFSSHSCTQRLAPGYYDLSVRYMPEDANPMYLDATATFEKAVQVIPVDDLKIKTQPKNVTALAGQTVSFHVEVTGGMAPYTYQWQVAAGNNGWRDAEGSWCIGYDSDCLTFTVDANEFYTGYAYRCVITDALGNTVASKTVAVLERYVEPLAVQIENGEPEIEYNVQGGKKTLTANVTGGVGPYTYSWYTLQFYPGANWVQAASGPQFELDPSQMNSFRIMVEVKDAAGKLAQSIEVFINVTGVIIN